MKISTVALWLEHRYGVAAVSKCIQHRNIKIKSFHIILAYNSYFDKIELEKKEETSKKGQVFFNFQNSFIPLHVSLSQD